MPSSASRQHAPDRHREISTVPLFISAVVDPSLRRRPDPDEAPSPIDAALAADLRARWTGKLQQPLELQATTGKAAAAIVVVAGTIERATEIFAFARGARPTGFHAGGVLDEPLGAAIDAVDGIVTDLAAGASPRTLPLDWEGRPVGDLVVFVRGERRDYRAEEQAALLLGEEAAPHALPGFPPPLS